MVINIAEQEEIFEQKLNTIAKNIFKDELSKIDFIFDYHKEIEFYIGTTRIKFYYDYVDKDHDLAITPFNEIGTFENSNFYFNHSYLRECEFFINNYEKIFRRIKIENMLERVVKLIAITKYEKIVNKFKKYL